MQVFKNPFCSLLAKIDFVQTHEPVSFFYTFFSELLFNVMNSFDAHVTCVRKWKTYYYHYHWDQRTKLLLTKLQTFKQKRRTVYGRAFIQILAAMSSA